MSTFGVTPAVGGLSTGTVGEASTALSSAAQVALQSLSHAMVSAEQQLQVLQEKQQQLLKLQQQVKNYHTLTHKISLQDLEKIMGQENCPQVVFSSLLSCSLSLCHVYHH